MSEWDPEVVERLRAFEELGADSVPGMLDELEAILAEREALVSTGIAAGTETAKMAGLKTLRELLGKTDER